jgi:ferrochelatase
VHSYALKEKLQEKIDRKSKGNYKIKLAMRYGEPSIKKSFIEFAQEGISQIKIFPLFPQYASATTGSVLQEIFDSISRKLNIPNIEIVPPYFDHPSYIQAKSQIILEYLKKKKKYINKFFFLFSFHGLPQRQVKNADKSGSHCLVKERCCEQITASNLFCYRAHCTKTAHELAKFLKLKNERWSLSFQSRLGRAEWLKPYTTQVIRELAENGTQNLLVVSPSFTADGLETLEELGMQEKNNFLRAGGKEFLLAPCLNNHPAWVDAILKIILK